MINEQDADFESYCNVVLNIAKENDLPLVDLRQEFIEYNQANNFDDLHSGLLTTDGVHLNERGNQLVADKIWNVLFPQFCCTLVTMLMLMMPLPFALVDDCSIANSS